MSPTLKHHLLVGVGAVVSLIIVYYVGLQVIQQLSGSRLIAFFSGLFGQELVADENDHTNVLLLGIGGEGHSGEDLTDTIIVASIDQKTKWVSMLSIPRDLYVSSSMGQSRVNKLYEYGKAKWDSQIGLDFTRDTISEVLDIPIHYVAKVDFAAFEKVVDSVGGIDIYVEHAINDPFYPLDGTYDYAPFSIAKGMNHLDGKTALKYVRSRKTSSDFDRSERQQQALIALRDKANEYGKLSKARFIRDLYYSLSDHVQTDLSIREIISFADFAASWDSAKRNSATIHDDPSQKGGFLYTPDRSLYGGAFVLIPAGGLDQLRTYARFVLYEDKGEAGDSIAILNGTKIPGFAGSARAVIQRYGIHVEETANAREQDLTATRWYVLNPTGEELLPFLTRLIPGEVVREVPQEYLDDPTLSPLSLILELGPESKKVLSEQDVFSGLVSIPQPTSTSSTESESSTAAQEPDDAPASSSSELDDLPAQQ